MTQIGYEYSAEIAEDGTATISIYFTQPSENATCFYLDGETWVSGSEMNIVYVDGQYYTMTNQMDTRRIFIVPDLSVGEEHEITIVGKYASISGFYLCEFNRDAYKKEIDELRKNQMDVISCEGNHIFGKIESEEGGILLATLPYDEGYTVLVDGQKVQMHAALDTFLSFPVTGGSHTIEIVYFPPGLKAGMMIMVFSLIAVALYYRKSGSGFLSLP